MLCRSSTKLLNICIASLCRAHSLEKAESVIADSIRLGILPNVVTYNTLIDAYCQLVGVDAAFCVLDRMREAGIRPDVISYNSLMAGAAKEGLLPRLEGKPDEATKIFWYIMNNDLSPSPATFNIMINGLCKNNYADYALTLFWYLRSCGFVPQLITYNTLINGLCKAGRVQAAKRILKELGESVIAALVKEGRTKEATDYMEQMMRSGIQLDIVSYNTLINLYCREGNLEAVSKLLCDMEKRGLECDKYTHTIMINGLCRSGDIKRATEHLYSMNMEGFDSKLVAYNCVVDGLGKAGQIDHAMEMFKSMERKDTFTYSSVVHNLCKARSSGFPSEAKRLRSIIRTAQMLRY
ncbi:hypothetical protein ACOSP7_008223 [Xanthoceras sorbifolium]